MWWKRNYGSQFSAESKSLAEFFSQKAREYIYRGWYICGETAYNYKYESFYTSYSIKYWVEVDKNNYKSALNSFSEKIMHHYNYINNQVSEFFERAWNRYRYRNCFSCPTEKQYEMAKKSFISSATRYNKQLRDERIRNGALFITRKILQEMTANN